MTSYAATVPMIGRPATAGRLVTRNFMMLWQSQLVSHFGNQAFAIAMTFWTASATHSATMTGMVLMGGVLPVVLLGPLTGTLVDRHRSPLRIVVTCDLASGVAVTLFALGLLVRPDMMRPSLLFAIALFVGVSNAFLEPAINALVPDLVPRDHIEGANAFRQSSRQITVLTAQGVGGILYVLVGPAMLFLIDGLSFLFAGVGELMIRPPHRGLENADYGSFFKQMADGFRYVVAQPGMIAFLIAVAVFNALLMPMSVLLPVFASAYLGGGALAGSALAGMTRATGAARGSLLVAAFALLAIALAALGQIRAPWVALAITFLTGVLSGLINVFVLSILQRRTPTDLRGRVLGLHAMMARALVPIGMIGGGAVADLTGRNVPLVFGICGGLALFSVLLLTMRRTTRAYLASA